MTTERRTKSMIERAAVATANWILRTFAPSYSAFIGGAVEYGMRAAAADTQTGAPNPPDWRGATQ